MSVAGRKFAPKQGQKRMGAKSCKSQWPREQSTGFYPSNCDENERSVPVKTAAFDSHAVQDVRIAGLTRELAELRRMIEMLTCLVDPEDVRAAMRLPHITPTTAEIDNFVENFKPSDEFPDLDD